MGRQEHEERVGPVLQIAVVIEHQVDAVKRRPTNDEYENHDDQHPVSATFPFDPLTLLDARHRRVIAATGLALGLTPR